jgi:hypothetical protein
MRRLSNELDKLTIAQFLWVVHQNNPQTNTKTPLGIIADCQFPTQRFMASRKNELQGD